MHSAPAKLATPHKVGAVMTVIVLVALIMGSWVAAARSEQGQRPRLRWYMVATISSPPGTRISATHLQRTLARLPPDSVFVPAPDRVLNTYTALPLSPGDRLIPECVFAAAPVFPRDTFAVVPVHLKKEDAVALQSGMRVALARDSHYLPRIRPDSGYELLALHVAGTTTTALIAVGRRDSASQRMLASGEWRAISLHVPHDGERPGVTPLPGACGDLLARDSVAQDSVRVRRVCVAAARSKPDCTQMAHDSAQAARARADSARNARRRAEAVRADSLRAASARTDSTAAAQRARRRR